MRHEIVDDCCGFARELIAGGLDPAEPLEFYRGDVLCLRGTVRAFAGRMVVETRNGPQHVAYRPFDGEAKARLSKAVRPPIA